MTVDYKELGTRIGLEIHCQLDTQHKLFCDCPTKKSKKFPTEVKRHLRAVAGELGKVDIAAVLEFEKGMAFVYKSNPDTSCLVELDCEPPHPMNREALGVALQVCKLLDSNIVEEVHIMRKTVVNGSNTSGFQRTSLIGTGGYIETSKGKVGVTNIQLEEDSATPIEKKDSAIVYRLDRLGVPLIELGTSPDIKDPEHLKETALRIGALLLATGKIKREIGSIRQDLNISIKGGSRIEVKGAQEPSMFPLIADREIQRQLALLAVKSEIKKRKAKIGKIVDLTGMFKESQCNFIRKAPCVLGLALHGFAGILGREVQPTRRVGTELADYAKSGGVGGIIHSDEDLSKYALKEESKIRQKLGIDAKGAFVLIASEPKLARRAIDLVRKRAGFFFDGVPSEVRQALKDGNTSYMRPMPGAARLYPETDCLPTLITPKILKSVRTPEKPEKTMKKLLKAGLSQDLAEKLMDSSKLLLFTEINTKNHSLLASTLTDTLTTMRRDSFETDKITNPQLIELFELYDKGVFAKESIPPILEALTLNPDKPVKELVNALGFAKMSEKQVKETVKQVVVRNQDALSSPKAFSIIMGEVMRKLRGKADGGLIAKAVQAEIDSKKKDDPTVLSCLGDL